MSYGYGDKQEILKEPIFSSLSHDEQECLTPKADKYFYEEREGNRIYLLYSARRRVWLK